jgi:Ca2+-dependent lipid-binding protein
MSSINNHYNVVGKLTVSLIKGSDLRDTNLLSKMSPYCIMQIGNEKLKSKEHNNAGRNPVWLLINHILIEFVV